MKMSKAVKLYQNSKTLDCRVRKREGVEAQVKEDKGY
jgi:hypothetical protein